tara:strand:- start:4628 stop:4903 length:276 start_codon:yes stop_codon:yes gene_type:complete
MLPGAFNTTIIACNGKGKIMLVLTRRIGETIKIGDDIDVTVLDIQGGQARIGIDAPREVRVDREEVRERPGFNPDRKPARKKLSLSKRDQL